MTQPSPQQSAASHLETLRSDIRDEVKRRIDQRDRYSIQLTLSLGAIVAFSFSKDGFRRALIAAPLVSTYFTVLILYSYRIHKLLAKYLREVIEPQLAHASGTKPGDEWERWYATQQSPGIRRWFFLLTLWVVAVLTMGYLFVAERGDPAFAKVVSVSAAAYLAAASLITKSFWRE